MKYDSLEVKLISARREATMSRDESVLLLRQAHAELSARAPELPLVAELARFLGSVPGRPVLDAIRRLCRLRQPATVSAIATASGQSRRQVLLVLDANRDLLQWNDHHKAIECDRVHGVLWTREWHSGRYYKSSPINYGAAQALVSYGQEALFARLAKPYVHGGLGDCWTTNELLDTPENRAVLEAAGLRPASEIPQDDRLWVE